ncbi:17884_t:CDS:1, partial [Gigaspora margarita]
YPRAVPHCVHISWSCGSGLAIFNKYFLKIKSTTLAKYLHLIRICEVTPGK